MRSLSTHRRHPLAGVVVLLLGLVAIGAVYAAFAPRAAEADSASEDLIAEGREIFLVSCASCHGVNADGIEQSEGGQYGPSLVGVGAAAVDFQVGTGRMPMAQNSQQAPREGTGPVGRGDRGGRGVRRVAVARARRSRPRTCTTPRVPRTSSAAAS